MNSRIRCAIYTRKSSEEGLEQSFNSLDAQREAGEAYVKKPTARRLANHLYSLQRWWFLRRQHGPARVEAARASCLIL